MRIFSASARGRSIFGVTFFSKKELRNEQTLRILHMMNKAPAKNRGRKAVNLYLPADTIGMLARLQEAMRRPSRSNVVEVLIHDAAKQKQPA